MQTNNKDNFLSLDLDLAEFGVKNEKNDCDFTESLSMNPVQLTKVKAYRYLKIYLKKNRRKISNYHGLIVLNTT